MPYALFEDDQKLSKEFPTEEEVWAHAEEAGLVDVVASVTKMLGAIYVLAAGWSGPPEAIPTCLQPWNYRRVFAAVSLLSLAATVHALCSDHVSEALPRSVRQLHS